MLFYNWLKKVQRVPALLKCWDSKEFALRKIRVKWTFLKTQLKQKSPIYEYIIKNNVRGDCTNEFPVSGGQDHNLDSVFANVCLDFIYLHLILKFSSLKYQV